MDGGELSTSALVDNDQTDVPIDMGRWQKLAEAVLATEGVNGPEVWISFVGEDRIAELKREHLDGDGSPTDVLAFPIDEPGGDTWDIVPALLGDVVICPAVAERQAPEHAGTLDDELALLLVHGLLHLLGHDHADDDERATMQARERALLAEHHGPLARDPWQEP